MQPSISIIPADQRMEHVADFLANKNTILCRSLNELAPSGLILCATPFSKDGIHLNSSLPSITLDNFFRMLTPLHTVVGGGFPSTAIQFFTQQGIPYYDVLSSENLAKSNARLTAEGFLISLLTETNYSIRECIPLIIGYGRCGREIAHNLSFFIPKIYIYDIAKDQRNQAALDGFETIQINEIQEKKEQLQHINTIINTAPANPFSVKTWQCFHNSCHVFQIASGELTLPYPLYKQYTPCPGIPGRYAPKTAGILIAKEICQHFHL